MKTIDNREFSVYMHTVPDGRVYIGMTSQKPEVRWFNGEGYRGNSAFYEVIQEEGWDNIEHEIIDCGLTKEEAAALEKELIAEFNSTDSAFGFNGTTGGDCFALGSGKSIYCVEKRRFYSNAVAAAHDNGVSAATVYNKESKRNGLTFLEMNEEEAEQYMMFEELEQYPSLMGISADELDDNICQLLFGE